MHDSNIDYILAIAWKSNMTRCFLHREKKTGYESDHQVPASVTRRDNMCNAQTQLL